MGKILSSQQEVEAHLRLLQEGQVPQEENLASVNLIPLVWQKIETPPQLSFSLTPAYAALLLILILISGLWAYQKSLLVSKQLVPIRELSVLSGIVLETGGFPTGEVKSTVSEGDQLITSQDSRLTFYFPGAGYFHLAENSVLKISEARQGSSEAPVLVRRGETVTPPSLRSGVPSDAKAISEMASVASLPRNDGIRKPASDRTRTGSLVHFEFFLEQGKLYSRLEDLEMGSVLQYRTPYATARVFGTDFLLSVNKDDGVLVEVLGGTVELGATQVEKGRRALISPDSKGTLLVTELGPEQQMKLKEDFERVFHAEALSHLRGESKGPSFRILSRGEE